MDNQNISGALSEIAELYPERTGLIVKKEQGYQSWTFADLDLITDCFAYELTDAGVTREDRIILMVKPSLEFICLTFALFRIGAIVILIDPGMGYKNLTRCITEVKPDVFIGIPAAHIFRKLFSSSFKTVNKKFCVGFSFGFFGKSLSDNSLIIKWKKSGRYPAVSANEDELAAILFTTGSTGPPKGVRYEHGVFQAQLKLIRDYYEITPEDIDQPAFPLFALFSTALGACAVIPDMNAAQPAKVDPERFIKSIIDHNVTYSFGSPAIWNVVSRYCIDRKIKLQSLNKVLMAGAPVSGELIERVKAIMANDGEIHTPYGATESLPISSMTGAEILADTWSHTREGKGTCVGRPLPGITIKILPISDEPVSRLDPSKELTSGTIGEIVVKGPVVTKAYDNNERENALSKIKEDGSCWHRLGDVGYFDNKGRLWFCGRKAHRVITADETLYTIPCEAIFNEHPAVFRSALVGVGPTACQKPVLIVELYDKDKEQNDLKKQLHDLAAKNRITRNIHSFLVHPGFPVDIRHNAKIFREKLALWAAEQDNI